MSLFYLFIFLPLSQHECSGGCKVQVAGLGAVHCFTITETTQSSTKLLTLVLNIIF